MRNRVRLFFFGYRGLNPLYTRLALLDTLPSATAVLFDPSIMAPVYQMVPGKGNFFLEQLAKTGAGETYQIFGQAGLDHGPEWMSAKFTNISTDMPSELTASTNSGGGTAGDDTGA